jgi:hypothetical protein
MISGAAASTVRRAENDPLKSGMSTSMEGELSAQASRTALMTDAKCPAPPSGRSSRVTEVMTTCLRPSCLAASPTRRGSSLVERVWSAGSDVAERAVAGADMAQDQKRGRALGIALEHVRALGVAADGMQPQPLHQPVGSGKGGATGQLGAQPRGDAQIRSRILGRRHA